MHTKSKIASAVAALTIAVAAAVAFAPAASAQEEEPAALAARQERRGAFLERVAGLLGIDAARLQEAITQAQLDVVEEALSSGRISDEQALKARERIEDGRGLGLRHGPREQRTHERRMRLRVAIIEQAAGAIGIGAEELREDLKAGSSIAEAAASRGVPIEDVKADLLEAAKGKLDQAMENGRIDQTRADDALQRFTDNLDSLLNRKRQAPATP